ncbi:hypothetical protein ACFLZ2_04585 [Candidatus Margulisiibacteriota bacterium]
MLAVAKYCIEYKKEIKELGKKGCYGYPATILLFSIADSIGSYVIGGKSKKHFQILNHKDYYNLKLNQKDLKIIYDNYRGILTHNAALPTRHFLDIGHAKSPVFEYRKDIPHINLWPFLKLSEAVVKKFLQQDKEIVMKSKKVSDIRAKGR